MTHTKSGRALTAKSLIRAALTALSLISLGIAHAQPAAYHAPAHNYYQNNWMAGGGG